MYKQICEICGEEFEDDCPPNVKAKVLCPFCGFIREMDECYVKEYGKHVLWLRFHPECDE